MTSSTQKYKERKILCIFDRHEWQLKGIFNGSFGALVLSLTGHFPFQCANLAMLTVTCISNALNYSRLVDIFLTMVF